MFRVRFSALIAASLLLSTLTLAACSSSGSNGETDLPPDTTPPGVPSGVTATSGDAEVELEWNAVSTSDLDGYNLYRATESIGSVEGITPVNGNEIVAETALTDGGVTNGTTYYYRVTAVDEAGNESDGSSQVTVTPFADPPTRP